MNPVIKFMSKQSKFNHIECKKEDSFPLLAIKFYILCWPLNIQKNGKVIISYYLYSCGHENRYENWAEWELLQPLNLLIFYL